MANSVHSSQSLTVILTEVLEKIMHARHSDPFEALGRHSDGENLIIRTYLPRAVQAWLGTSSSHPMEQTLMQGVFEWREPATDFPFLYRILWHDKVGNTHCEYDSYSFLPQLSNYDIHLLGEDWYAYSILGAHIMTFHGVEDVLFATWAPEAERVSVVGDLRPLWA